MTECKICGNEADLSESYCEECALDGEKIYLMKEGNISKNAIEQILKERLGR